MADDFKSFSSVNEFLVDYLKRHAHPINAVLHIFGVPMAFYGMYLLIVRSFLLGFALIFFGYLFQYLGHKAQGNEVGEVTLLKGIWRKISSKGARQQGG